MPFRRVRSGKASYARVASGLEATGTALDLLVDGLRGRATGFDGQDRAAAILWTDPGREWERLLPALRHRMPELLTLGPYEPDTCTGPAIWLRCLVEGAVQASGIPVGSIPVLYLPGFERAQLRAGEACPEAVKPLVELLYRGVVWTHPNGRDWTVHAFLGSPKGVGLDIAVDRPTLDALRGALNEVAITPLHRLRGRRLDADDFNQMLVGDFRRDLLRWMGDPDATRARLDNAWAAFGQQCANKLGFDPGAEADVVAGARLGEARDGWADLWDRFAEAPHSYPGVEELLSRSRPAGELPFDRERWPDLNEEDETAVKNALAGLAQRPSDQARAGVLDLEKEHGRRRGWVWARLDRSPMAAALQPLARLAEATRSAIGGIAPDAIAASYADIGWQADASAREALASAPDVNEAKTIAAVVRLLLEPWLQSTAVAFQAALNKTPLPGRGDQPRVEARGEECLVFVDGLRYELGPCLAERLERRGCDVSVDRRWAAIPTVTSTGKPAVTPVSDVVAGDSLSADFRPSIRTADASGSSRAAIAAQLRKVMKARGYHIVDDGALDLLGPGIRGWLEIGKIDHFGHHSDGPTFARMVEAELDQVAERVHSLLDAGWRSVRVVTDHGWLWLPGGLPMVSLPQHLTKSQWSRCAVVSGDSTPDVPRYPWHWNASEWFATPPGIACFSKRDEYAHGGLSIQECLIPDIRVERGARSRTAATIHSITWRGLRCFAEVQARGGSVTADLRLGSPSGRSVAAMAKAVQEDGSVSLVLAGDEHEEAALVLVVTDADGRVLSQQPTRVGDDA